MIKMKITIICECGNMVIMHAPSRKFLQFRDMLETEQFHYDDENIKEGKLKEIRIKCDKCGNWVILGVD